MTLKLIFAFQVVLISTVEPLWYMKPRYENSKDGNRQVKNIVFNLELAAVLLPKNAHTIDIIVDFHDASSGNTPGVGMAKQFLDILGNH